MALFERRLYILHKFIYIVYIHLEMKHRREKSVLFKSNMTNSPAEDIWFSSFKKADKIFTILMYFVLNLKRLKYVLELHLLFLIGQTVLVGFFFFLSGFQDEFEFTALYFWTPLASSNETGRKEVAEWAVTFHPRNVNSQYILKFPGLRSTKVPGHVRSTQISLRQLLGWQLRTQNCSLVHWGPHVQHHTTSSWAMWGSSKWGCSAWVGAVQERCLQRSQPQRFVHIEAVVTALYEVCEELRGSEYQSLLARLPNAFCIHWDFYLITLELFECKLIK